MARKKPTHQIIRYGKLGDLPSAAFIRHVASAGANLGPVHLTAQMCVSNLEAASFIADELDEYINQTLSRLIGGAVAKREDLQIMRRAPALMDGELHAIEAYVLSTDQLAAALKVAYQEGRNEERVS